jgi:hypothetical protein
MPQVGLEPKTHTALDRAKIFIALYHPVSMMGTCSVVVFIKCCLVGRLVLSNSEYTHNMGVTIQTAFRSTHRKYHKARQEFRCPVIPLASLGGLSALTYILRYID